MHKMHRQWRSIQMLVGKVSQEDQNCDLALYNTLQFDRLVSDLAFVGGETEGENETTSLATLRIPSTHDFHERRFMCPFCQNQALKLYPYKPNQQPQRRNSGLTPLLTLDFLKQNPELLGTLKRDLHIESPEEWRALWTLIDISGIGVARFSRLEGLHDNFRGDHAKCLLRGLQQITHLFRDIESYASFLDTLDFSHEPILKGYLAQLLTPHFSVWDPVPTGILRFQGEERSFSLRSSTFDLCKTSRLSFLQLLDFFFKNNQIFGRNSSHDGAPESSSNYRIEEKHNTVDFKHFSFTFRNSGIFLTDLGTLNGTWKRIAGTSDHVLKSGDSFICANTLFKVEESDIDKYRRHDMDYQNTYTESAWNLSPQDYSRNEKENSIQSCNFDYKNSKKPRLVVIVKNGDASQTGLRNFQEINEEQKNFFNEMTVGKGNCTFTLDQPEMAETHFCASFQAGIGWALKGCDPENGVYLAINDFQSFWNQEISEPHFLNAEGFHEFSLGSSRMRIDLK